MPWQDSTTALRITSHARHHAGRRTTMYTVIRVWEGDEDQLEESTEKVRDRFIPQIKDVKGFHSYYFLHGDGGNVATISVFDDRKGAEQSTTIARSFAEEELEDIVQGPPEIIEGTVAIHEAAQR